MERVTAGTDEIPFSHASPDLSGPGSDRNRLATWPEPRRGKLQKNAIASLRLSRPLAQEQPVGRHSGALHETVDLAEFFTNRTILESTYEIDVPASGSEEWPLQNKNNDKAGQEPSSRAIALSNKHSRLESHSVHNYDLTSPSRSTSVTSAQYRNSFNEWSIQYNSSVASPQLPDDTIKKSLMVFEAHPAQDDHATYTTQSAGMPRQAQSDPLSEGIPLRQPHSLGSVNGVTKNYNVGKNPPIMSGNADVSGPSIGKSNGAHINIYQNAPQYTEASALHQATSQRKNTSKYDRSLRDFFLQCAPTDERLEELGKRWLDRVLLRRRLFHCRPFNIMVQDNLKGYAEKSNHELSDHLSDDNHWDKFAEQMSSAWPKSFGKLVPQDDGEARQFLFGAPYLDDDTIFACRKVCELGELPSRVEILFNGVKVHLDHDDDVLWQVMPSIATTSLSISTVALLECLFAPIHNGYTGSGISGFGTLIDWFPIQNTTPVLYRSGDLGLGDWLCIRVNLRTCVPDDEGFRARRFKDGSGCSPAGLGFPLKRQAARLPGLSKDGDQSAVEYLLSVAIVMRKKVQNEMPSILKYSVVNWVDYRTDLNARSERTSRAPVLSNAVDRDLDLKDCGTGASGFVQFLIVLARAIDHWAKCWDAMLDKIDETVGVQLQDTLDKKRWEMLMFDNSFQLSEQYFTVLQLLRIYQDWIVEAEEGIDSLGEELINQCRSWHAWQHQLSPVDEVEWPLLMENLKSNFSNVNGFFRQRVNSLKERIQRKKDEVESLRDGLFNAASLRENLKANTMNLYIGVFTIVTVFFTPLSFIATFWAIPYTSTDARSSTPKEFLTSFITVPLLTYIASGGIIAYVWTRASPSLETSIQVKLRRVSGIIWESLGKLFSTALGKFRKRSKNIPLDKEANSAKADSLDQWSS